MSRFWHLGKSKKINWHFFIFYFYFYFYCCWYRMAHIYTIHRVVARAKEREFSKQRAILTRSVALLHQQTGRVDTIRFSGPTSWVSNPIRLRRRIRCVGLVLYFASLHVVTVLYARTISRIILDRRNKNLDLQKWEWSGSPVGCSLSTIPILWPTVTQVFRSPQGRPFIVLTPIFRLLINCQPFTVFLELPIRSFFFNYYYLHFSPFF